MGASQPSSSPDLLAALLEDTLDCVHCGMCLPVCPTYRETGRETSSPRGRIYLMRAVAEGRAPLGPALAEEAYLCLGCRACETACPSGVRYGSLLERTRAAVEAAGLRSGPARRLETLALHHLIPHRRRLRVFTHLLGLFQRTGLERVAVPVLPGRLRDMIALAPPVPRARDRRPLPPLTPALGSRRGRVAFFEGCLMRELFGPVNHATVRVLARNGFDVVVPPNQACCGALHAHAGDDAFARRLARRNLRAFQPVDVDAIVANSAGCGAALREMSGWLPGQAEDFVHRVRDVCELLDEAGLRTSGARFEARVCYDDACHLLHAQRVRDAPRNVLTAIPGVHLVPHEDPGACCGAAGIYNLTHPEMSQAVLDRKLDALLAAQPEVVATGNPGCLMQLRAGMLQRGSGARVAHPVQLLDEAYTPIQS